LNKPSNNGIGAVDWSCVASVGLVAPACALLLEETRHYPPEPPPVLSAAAVWASLRRRVNELTPRERALTIRYRQAAMAEHGAWLRKVREIRDRRSLRREAKSTPFSGDR
jgi:hypothetical protein